MKKKMPGKERGPDGKLIRGHIDIGSTLHSGKRNPPRTRPGKRERAALKKKSGQ